MKEDETMDAFTAKLNGYATKAKELGKTLDESLLVRKLLDSTPDRFIQIVASIEQTNDLDNITLDEIIGKLKAFEERIKLRKGRQVESQENLLFAQGEHSRKGRRFSKRGSRSNFSRGNWLNNKNKYNSKEGNTTHKGNSNRNKGEWDLSKVRCFKCQKLGHLKKDCRGTSKTQEQSNLILEDDEPSLLMTIHETEHEEVSLNEGQIQPRKYASEDASIWYLDNGASNHMTGTKSHFRDINESITGRIRFGDGSYVQIKGRGSILLGCKNNEQKIVSDVYYIPNLKSNIISLGQLTEIGCKIIMDGNKLTLYDKNKKLLIKVERSKNRLYSTRLQIEAPICLLANVDNQAWLWHARLGHLNFDDINKKIQGKSISLLKLCTPRKEIDLFKSQMKDKFEMSDLGLLAYYLGIEVTQTGGEITIKQTGYINKILKETSMTDSNDTKIPMDPGTKLVKAEDGNSVDATYYRSLIGSLRYLLHTRPDLSYSVGLLSRFMQDPKDHHLKAVKQVIRYIKGTKEHGIIYKKEGGCKITGYSDSSYGINTDQGKGTTGIVFYFGESPITWCTQKQPTVALSSCESEFMAATGAACQALWLKRLLSELTGWEEKRITLKVDNISAIALVRNPVFHGRSKHIDIRYHFIRECVENGHINVEHVSGELQRADILTKALPRLKFVTMRQMLGVQDLGRSNDQD
ncbi:zinc finger, CCHC-type containing protein [Tanacetum coccineum]